MIKYRIKQGEFIILDGNKYEVVKEVLFSNIRKEYLIRLKKPKGRKLYNIYYAIVKGKRKYGSIFSAPTFKK